MRTPDDLRHDRTLHPIGRVVSPLTRITDAPRQGDEGAPSARIVLARSYEPALRGIEVGDRLVVVTWLHLADRGTLTVHPRGDASRRRTGVFATRSPHRPNPVGLHDVTVVAVGVGDLTVDALEAIDGTPVLDIKPALGAIAGR